MYLWCYLRFFLLSSTVKDFITFLSFCNEKKKSNFSWMNTCLNDITQFSDFIGHQYISLWLNLKLLLIVRKCLSALSLSWPDTSCQHATIFLIVLHTVGHSEGQQKDQRGDLIHPCFSTIHTNRNAPEFKVPLDVEEKQVVQTFCK